MANYKVSAEVSADTSKFKKQIQAAKRVSEKFKKVVDKLRNNEVDANTASFDKKIDKSKSKAEKLDKMKIDPDVTLDISEFSRKSNEVQNVLDEINRKNIDPKIEADTKRATTNLNKLISITKELESNKVDIDIDAITADAEKRIRLLNMNLKSIENSKATVEIRANAEEARRKIAETKKELLNLAKQRATAKLNVDSKLANSEVSRFKALLRSIPNKIKTRLTIDSNGFQNALKGLNRQVDVFQDRMDRIAKSIRTFGTIGANTIQGTLLSSFSALIPVIGGLVPAIAAVGNATVALGGGAVGAAGAFGVLRLGITGFAGMAASAIQMLDKGMIQASNATNEYKSALSGVKSTWQSIVKENASQIFYAMASGIRSASNALNQMRPFLSGIAGLINTNAAKLNTWVTSSGTAQRAFEALNTTGVKIFGNLLSAGGHFGDGLVEIFTQLMPLFEWSSKGFQSMALSFQKWAHSVEGSQAIQGFINYTKTNLPIIGNIFKNTFIGIFNIFKAFAPNSTTIFQSLEKMTQKFAEWSAGIAKSDGFKKFVQYMNENGPVIMQLIGNVAMALVNFGIAMAPIASQVLKAVTAFAGWIAKLFETHPAVAQLVGVSISLAGALMALVPNIVGITTFIGPLITKFAALVAKVGIGKATFQALSKVFSLLFGKASLVRGIITILASVFGALSAPVLAIIAVIGSLVAIFVYLWKTNDGFREACINAWNVIKETVSGVVNAIVSFVQSIWGGLVAWWQENHTLIQNAATTVWNAIKTVIMTVMNVLGPSLKASWEVIKQAIIIVWEVIKTTVQLAINAVSGIIKVVMQLITGDWSGAWNTIKETAMNAWNIIKEGASNIFNALKSALSAIWEAIKTNASNVWNGLKTAVIAVVNAVKAGVQAQWNAIKSVTSSVFNAVKSVVSSIWNGIKTLVSTVIGAIKSVVTSGFNAVKSAVNSVMNGVKSVISSIWNAVKSIFSSAIGSVKSVVSSGFNAARSTVSNIMGAIKSTISNVWSGIRSTVSNAVHSMGSAMSNGMSSMRSAVSNGMSSVSSAVRNGISNAASAVRNGVYGMVSAGADLARGIGRGIMNMAGYVMSRARELASRAVSAIKRALRIHSPSRVMRDEVGVFIAKGLTVGMMNEGRNTIKSAAKLGDRVAGAFTPQIQTPEISGITQGIKGLQDSIQSDINASYNVQAEPTTNVIKIQLDLDDEAITAKVDGVHATKDMMLVR
ncbi:TPA: hypothetical protein RSU91_000585 [Staphylococcus aureus]|nr:hypothetical protein [Staphylococcus aureus]HDZ3300174.1 hypothetical protein [Staphylococcus aureus]HDZ3315938.1 hypothetical protein [Staphylococcus aureus]HDZ3340125.1 hypothetical protein [Staphylococcus aureus]